MRYFRAIGILLLELSAAIVEYTSRMTIDCGIKTMMQLVRIEEADSHGLLSDRAAQIPG